MTTNQDKIHVIYVLTKLELGGAQKVCLELMKSMEQKAFSCSLISGNTGVLCNQALQFKSVFFIDDFKREIGFSLFIKELKALGTMVNIMRKLKEEHPNIIVHTHSTKAGIFGRWAAFFAGIKTRIHTIHGFGFHDNQNPFAWWLFYFFELITAPLTTHFVCVSLADAKTGQRLLPGFGKKYSIIRAAVDHQKFSIALSQDRTINTAKKVFTIGTISCFKEQKNLFDLLQAFFIVHTSCAAQGKNVTLAIIGDGEQRPALEAWIAEHNLTKAITLLGWRPDITPFLKEWDIYAMSSLWEGLPCAIIEARLCKLPVICYNVGGIAEVIIDGKNGFLIPPHDWQMLARKIQDTLDDPNLLESLSMFKDNLTAFDTQTMVDLHAQLYKKLTLK